MNKNLYTKNQTDIILNALYQLATILMMIMLIVGYIFMQSNRNTNLMEEHHNAKLEQAKVIALFIERSN